MNKSTKQCRLFRAEGRSFYGHTMSTCGYIGNAERGDMAKTYKVDTTYGDEALEDDMQQLNFTLLLLVIVVPLLALLGTLLLSN